MHPHSPSHSNLGPLLMAIASLGLILFAAGSGKRSQSAKNTPPQRNAEDLHSDGTSDPHPSGTESRSGSGGLLAGSAGPAGKPVESSQSTAGASPQQEAYESAPSTSAAGAGNGEVMSAPLAEPTSQKPTATDPSISSDNVETVPTSLGTPSKSPGNTR